MERIKNILHHIFIPNEKNNFKAKALHIDALTYYLLFALLFTFITSRQYTPFRDVLGFATDISVDKLYSLTNQKRAENNLSPLSYNAQLADAANHKAQDMFAKNYWAHFGPSGETPWNFILNSGYKYEYAGENLAKNFLFSDAVMQAWMDSPTHRDNILRSEYTEVGFAVVNGVLNGEETTLVVQMFGKSLDSSQQVAQLHNINTQPTLIPTVLPSLTPVPTSTENIVQGQTFQLPAPPAVVAAESSSPKVNIKPLALKADTAFLLFIFIALLLDLYFASKKRVFRIGGKNIAHLLFVAFILIGILFITRGNLLQAAHI